MWSPEWTQLYWNEKLQKKMLGTKINNDETENIISNTIQVGFFLLVNRIYCLSHQRIFKTELKHINIMLN